MFDLIIRVTGVAVGLGAVLLAHRNQRAETELTARARSGELNRSQAGEALLGSLYRSRIIGLLLTTAIAGLLAAVLIRAAVTGEWGAMTMYYLVLLGLLLAWTGIGHARTATRITQAKAEVSALTRAAERRRMPPDPPG
ncbi:hypothetical protein ACFWZ7_03430 [Nocardiopsis alba]|uniref:Uncharacterized protein n=1 Tax=Nocardiopsis alba (strain ATCC BAA-2165 / BE74) TaxID=1205910 RepID=J7LFK5_NOCAA|nr:hypothetical protein [Nocardiopsis alba]AFR10230.1 hypothetical protein B005_4931 [Nocardiopsis alba ATCC BAA-2165]